MQWSTYRQHYPRAVTKDEPINWSPRSLHSSGPSSNVGTTETWGREEEGNERHACHQLTQYAHK